MAYNVTKEPTTASSFNSTTETHSPSFFVDKNGLVWPYYSQDILLVSKIRRNVYGKDYEGIGLNYTIILHLWEKMKGEWPSHEYIMFCIKEYQLCHNLTSRIEVVARAALNNKLFPEAYRIKQIELGIFGPVVLIGVTGKQICICMTILCFEHPSLYCNITIE